MTYPYRILVKVPTRERPKQFNERVHRMIDMQAVRPGSAGEYTSEYLFAVDDDDTGTLALKLPTKLLAKGPRVSKIEACNRGVSLAEWDIVVLASDDMICQVQGWDEIIRQDMATHFPDTDGCLWYPDGHQENLCTLAVMGRKAFDTRGHIYHPSYFSLWCDKEWTEYWQAQGKLWKSERTLFSHLHPGWKTAKMDPLYRKNNTFDRRDMLNFQRRQALGFPA